MYEFNYKNFVVYFSTFQNQSLSAIKGNVLKLYFQIFSLIIEFCGCDLLLSLVLKMLNILNQIYACFEAKGIFAYIQLTNFTYFLWNN